MQPLKNMFLSIFNSIESTQNITLSAKIKRKKKKLQKIMPFCRKTKHNLIYVFFVKGREKKNKCQCSLWIVKINVYFILYVLEVPHIFIHYVKSIKILKIIK